MQTLQAKAVKKCEFALAKWRAVDRRKPKGETVEVRAAREKRIADIEAQIAKLLVLGLSEHERDFHALKPNEVAGILRGQRANASPYSLLAQLAIRAEVWPSTSPDGFREAVRAQEK